MIHEIRRVAVLGSGVMGSAIAAHLANCGIPSLMLDILPPGAPATDRAKRNAVAAGARQALLKAKPAPLYRTDDLALIEVGNLEDDIARIADCDWVIEVVKEALDVKRTVFAAVAKHRRPGTIVSTNTSGVLLSALAEGMDSDMRRHFLGTHFFNPPRYLKLMEIIPGPEVLPEVVRFMAAFSENILGKGVVYAKDTPNFVGNRILTFACQYIASEFTKDGLTVEDVDALTGPEVGHASSATFRTLDIVGIDTYLHVIKNVYDNCPGDEARELCRPLPWTTAMAEKGLLGAKAGAGFYKRTSEKDEKGRPVILSLDVETLEYRPQRKPSFACLAAAKSAATLEAKVRAMHTGDDPGARFAWKVFANTAVYAANRIPEIADDIVNIDNAVKWGFAWEIGLFETWDVLGFDEVCARMEADGIALPPIALRMREKKATSFYKVEKGQRYYFDLALGHYRLVSSNPRELVLADAKMAHGTLKKNDSCALIDLGDGILCAEFQSKLNTIDGDLLNLLEEGVRRCNEDQFEGLVVANQGPHFCAGANLMLILGEVMQQRWEALEAIIRLFHRVNMAMRYCRKPVVAAPHHYTFGGGIELCQHAARTVIAAETYGGLVEFGVGIIPAGGGTKEMLRRALAYVPANVPEGDPFPYVRRAFETIAQAKVSGSGPESIDIGYLSAQDFICVNFEHQVQRAKNVCLGLAQMGYTPPRPAVLTALGEPARAALRTGVYQFQLAGYATGHDVLIAEQLARVMTGGDRPAGASMTEQDVLDLECEAMLSLCGTEKTQQRMQHMLAQGKPLRN